MKRERTKTERLENQKNPRGRKPKRGNPFLATLYGCKVKWCSIPGSRCLNGLSAPTVGDPGCPNFSDCLGFIAKQNWPGWVLVNPGPDCPEHLLKIFEKGH